MPGCTAEIFEKFVQMLEKQSIETLEELNAARAFLGISDPEAADVPCDHSGEK